MPAWWSFFFPSSMRDPESRRRTLVPTSPGELAGLRHLYGGLRTYAAGVSLTLSGIHNDGSEAVPITLDGLHVLVGPQRPTPNGVKASVDLFNAFLYSTLLCISTQPMRYAARPPP